MSTLRTFAAVAVSLVTWFLLQWAISVAMSLYFTSRGQDPTTLMWILRNLINPGIAAGCSLALVEKIVPYDKLRTLIWCFIGAVVVLSVWGLQVNANVYLKTQRSDEWQDSLWAFFASTLGTIVGTFAFASVDRSWRDPKVQLESAQKLKRLDAIDAQRSDST